MSPGGEIDKSVFIESDDERSAPRRQRKKSKPVLPTTSSKIASLASATMSNPKMRLGELAAREYEFCPLQAVTKYPYRYLNKADSEAVSNLFFAAGRFRARGWSLYYIHTYLTLSTKPLILVPAVEFQALLADIDKALGIQLEFPSTSGFRICFSDKGSPRARYLGQLTADMDLISWERKIPDPDFKENGENEVLDERSFTAFKKKIEASIEVGKNRSKSAKEKRKNERVVVKKSWCAQLKRAQRYLGVRPCRTATEQDDPLQRIDLPWEEMEKARKAYELAAGIDLPDWDVTAPAPHRCDLDVVFVCVDVEAYEREPRPITEIGISSLDTRDLMNVAPGEGGMAWLSKIRSRHFRIRETSHLRNTEFVAGCADRFEKAFGTSEWISKKEAPKVVASCFRPPFGVHPSDATANSQYPTVEQPQYGASQSNGSALYMSNVPPDNDAQPKRNLILVGHDIKSDIEYLRDLGYDVSNLSNLLEAIDTTDLYRALKKEQNPRNLGQVLLELGLTGWNLHNAGNDAAYTLQAMIGIAFAGLANNRDPEATTRAEQAARLETVAKEAQDRLKEDSEEWELAEGEGGDGGSAVGFPRRGGGEERKDFGALWAKSRGNTANEKAVEERKRAQQNAGARPLGSAVDRSVCGNPSFSSPPIPIHPPIPTNPPVATCALPPSHTQQEPEHPTTTEELPTQFTQRMAYLNLDDDEDGGVSIVYK